MGINVGKNYGAWQNVGGSFEQFPDHNQLIKESRDRYHFSFSDAELFQITTPNLYIVYGDILFKQHQLYFAPSNEVPDMIKLRFTLSGKGIIYNQVNKQQYIFRSNQQNIIYMPELDGTGEYDTSQQYRFFEVHFAKEKFLQLAEHSNRSLQVLADHLDAGRYAQMAPQDLPISWAMQNCVQEILTCPYSGGLKLLFIEAKCAELLVLQAACFENAISGKRQLSFPAASDQDCIYHARDYLIEHIHQPPSLSDLAKICGINEYKLKQGFKGLFHQSVFSYLNNYKLHQAKELLLQGMPIKAVAFQFGYSSVQHFSNAFKQKFAVSPGKVRG